MSEKEIKQKQEIEQKHMKLRAVEQKFGPLATINSIMIGAFVTIMIYLINENIIDKNIVFGIFIPLLSFQVMSLGIIIIGMFPKDFKEDEISEIIESKTRMLKCIIWIGFPYFLIVVSLIKLWKWITNCIQKIWI